MTLPPTPPPSPPRLRPAPRFQLYNDPLPSLPPTPRFDRLPTPDLEDAPFGMFSPLDLRPTKPVNIPA
ncbi:Protein of unknown function [Pyronema omphalodes CBS 100304]|uniref:Uncharacterized protein n=1 Tax=Pyronema omphalodes (strain CBS 100304) TaxID=1076935 RepID=U4KY68_PYROM|nr:Protein of unknown function [Pyronema omphalodes CBS 100304]